MTNFHLRGTGLEGHSLLNEEQVVVKKSMKHLGVAGRASRRLTSCKCWALAAVLSALWLTFFGLWAYCNFFKDGGGWAEAVGHNVEADLVVLPSELAEKTGAYCLDGSPPSYYFRNASSEEHGHSWIIHLYGSSWCYNNTACAHRSATNLGSSRMLIPRQQFDGILSANVTVNPDFYDWNVVVINYCDGASFSGNREEPVSYNNTKIYYRGARVLDAVVNYLLQSAELGEADSVIFSGDSAGAFAVYLHADRIRSMIPDAISFKAMADGGFFLDETNAGGEEQWTTAMKRVYDMQQVEGSLDEDCLLAKGGSNKWECFFPEHAYPYVTTPIFIINSAYDKWVQRNILNLRCPPSQCRDAVNLLEGHKETFIRRTDQVNRYDKDGMFVTACSVHCQTIADTPWTTYKVAGKTTRAAFADWYFERSTPTGSRYVDCDSSYRCNPTCSETWEMD